MSIHHRRASRVRPECGGCDSGSTGIFRDLEGAALGRLDAAKIPHSYRRGQTLFHEGSLCGSLYCIRSGRVKVYKTAPRDRRHILYIAEAGDTIGLESLLTGEVHSTTAEMMEDGVVCQVERARLLDLIGERSDLALRVSRELAAQLLRSHARRTELASADVRQRLAHALLSLASRFGDSPGNGAHIAIDLSREELAEIIGASTETTIRQLSELRAHGVVSTKGKRIVLEDVDRLARLARANGNGNDG